MVTEVIELGSMMPLPIVAATAVLKRNADMKFAIAAMSTALRGVKTRVATIVAIELALS
jgi:hypothetical protein